MTSLPLFGLGGVLLLWNTQSAALLTTIIVDGNTKETSSLWACGLEEGSGNIECFQHHVVADAVDDVSQAQSRFDGKYAGISIGAGSFGTIYACAVATESKAGQIDCWIPDDESTPYQQIGYLPPQSKYNDPYRQVTVGGSRSGCDMIACAIRYGGIDCFNPHNASGVGNKYNNTGTLHGNYSAVVVGGERDDVLSTLGYVCATSDNPGQISCFQLHNSSGVASLSQEQQLPSVYSKVSVNAGGYANTFGCATRANQTAVDCFRPNALKQNGVSSVAGSFLGSYSEVSVGGASMASCVSACGLRAGGIDCFNPGVSGTSRRKYKTTGSIVGEYQQVAIGGAQSKESFCVCAIRAGGDAIDCFYPYSLTLMGGSYKIEATFSLPLQYPRKPLGKGQATTKPATGHHLEFASSASDMAPISRSSRRLTKIQKLASQPTPRIRGNKQIRRNIRGLKNTEHTNIFNQDAVSDSGQNGLTKLRGEVGRSQNRGNKGQQQNTETSIKTSNQKERSTQGEEEEVAQMEDEDEGVAITAEPNSPGRKGFLDGFFGGLMLLGKHGAAGALGAAVGAGGLLAIFCAAGTICGDNTQDSTVTTSGIIEIDLSGPPDEADISGENGLIDQLNAFYTVTVAEALGATATTSNAVNAFGGKIDVNVDAMPVEFISFEISEYTSTLETIARAKVGRIYEHGRASGSNNCRQKLVYTASNVLRVTANSVFDPKMIDISIQLADEQVLLTDYIKQAGSDTSVYRNDATFIVSIVSTTTDAPTHAPTVTGIAAPQDVMPTSALVDTVDAELSTGNEPTTPRPSYDLSPDPTQAPVSPATDEPSKAQTTDPTHSPTKLLTLAPSSSEQTSSPSPGPSTADVNPLLAVALSVDTEPTTPRPSHDPSPDPTQAPVSPATDEPSKAQTTDPTHSPTNSPSFGPSSEQTSSPNPGPSVDNVFMPATSNLNAEPTATDVDDHFSTDEPPAESLAIDSLGAQEEVDAQKPTEGHDFATGPDSELESSDVEKAMNGGNENGFELSTGPDYHSKTSGEDADFGTGPD